MMGSSFVDVCFQWVGWGWGVGLPLLLLLGWVVMQVVRAVRWVWWTPRRLERALREQGIRGNPYRLLFGDIRESTRLANEAKLKPMASLSHDIASRVAPFQHRSIKTHGAVICGEGGWSSFSDALSSLHTAVLSVSYSSECIEATSLFAISASCGLVPSSCDNTGNA